MHAGYRMEEVDDFLDVVEQTLVQLSEASTRAAEIEAMLRTQCDQLQARIDHLEQQPVIAGDPDMLMRVAQATVDELVRAARQHSEAVPLDSTVDQTQEIPLPPADSGPPAATGSIAP
jgi:cell division septum initiation protein DivIVA